MELAQAPATYNAGFAAALGDDYRLMGNKTYELTNHLGNVMATVSDKKLGIAFSFSPAHRVVFYQANVLSVQDYYPFGMGMPGRSYTNTAYRYG